jgi:hypothetical protein
MGMHHGMVAAVGSADRLIAALDAQLPSLASGEGRGTMDDLIRDDDAIPYVWQAWIDNFGDYEARPWKVWRGPA